MNLRNLLYLLRNVSAKSVKKGELIIHAGNTKKEIFFIRKGLFRSYLINDKAEEITFQLYPENSIVGNVHAVVFNEPSKFIYQALEDSKVYYVDYSAFSKMATKNPRFLEMNRMFLGPRIIKQSFQRVESFVFLSPEERYKKYAKDYPNVINRAPDKYIAHVLGITPVSLSRIRNRIANKKTD